MTINATHERRFQDLQTTIKTIEESLTKRVKNTEDSVTSIQNMIPLTM
jgi:hypothetical protein